MKVSVPTRDGHRLHVRIHGRGRPVVLLHGFGSRGAHWLSNVLPLTPRYRFILPDMRGFGGSHDVPFTDPDVLSTFARDIEDVFDHLGLDRVILGGVSMGAYASLRAYTLGKLDRVSKYLHIDQAPRIRNDAQWRHGLFGEDQEKIFARFRGLLEIAAQVGHDTDYWALPREVRLEFRRTAASFFCFALNGSRQQALIRRIMEDAEPLVARAIMPVRRWSSYLTIMRAYMEDGVDARPALRDMRIPVTVMVGMRSRMYPPAGQLALAAAIPRSRVVRFERSGHVPMMDEPLKFQRELGRFLES